MARRGRKKGRRGSGKMTLPMAIIAPVAMAGYQVYQQRANPVEAQYILTGIGSDGSFHMDRIIKTYAPMAAGVVIHKLAKPVNASLGRAKVPFIRV